MFSISGALMTPLKLKVYKYFHRNNCESIVHNGSTIEIIFLINFFILFHSVFVDCGIPSWYINKGDYHTNTRALFFIVEKYYHIDSEVIQHIISNQNYCVQRT